MFQNIGFTELLLIAIVALVIFGPQKLPEIGRVLGRTIRDFKNGAHALLNDEPQTPVESKPAAPVSTASQTQAQSSTVSTSAAETAASTRSAIEFVSTNPSVVESSDAVDKADKSEAGSIVAIETAESASVDLPTMPPITSAAPVLSPEPPATQPNGPSSTRRLPD